MLQSPDYVASFAVYLTLGVLGVDMDKAHIDQLLTPIPPELEAEVDQFRAALKAESDRGCALIVASYLDVSLEGLLDAALAGSNKIKKNLLDTSRPLGTFSARIDLSYCVGLLPELIYRDMHLIREIRNDFAHAPVAATFQQPDIKSRCGNLRCIVLEPQPGVDHTRRRFIMSALAVLGYLHKEARSVEQWKVPRGPDFEEFRALAPATLAEMKRRAGQPD